METSVLRFLWRYARKLKWLYVLLLLNILFGQVLSRSTNWASAQIVEVISKGAPDMPTLHVIGRYLLLIFVCLSLQTVVMLVNRRLDMRFLPYYLGKMSKDLFVWAHKHSTAFFAEEMAGNISGKIKTILNNTEMLYYNSLGNLLFPLCGFLTAFVFIGTVSVTLAVWFLLLSVTLAFVSIRIKRRITPFSVRKAKLLSESNGILVDSISNSDLVKNCANFNYERRIYYNSVRTAMKALRREVRTSTWTDVFARSVNDVMNISFYLITFYYWYRHQLGIGDVVLVLSLISSMIQSTFYMGYFFTQYTQLAGGIKDGLDLLNKPCDVKDAPSARPLKVMQGAVSFCRVEYRYKASNVCRF